AIAVWFAFHGALRPFLDNTLAHNSLWGLGLWNRTTLRAFLFAAVLALLCWCAQVAARRIPDAVLALRRALGVLAPGVCVAGVPLLWPMLEFEHLLPFYPVLVIFLVPPLLTSRPWSRFGLQWLDAALDRGLGARERDHDRTELTLNRPDFH